MPYLIAVLLGVIALIVASVGLAALLSWAVDTYEARCYRRNRRF